MSGQASQSRLRYLARRREVLARIITRNEGHVCKDGSARSFRVEQLLGGSLFDVHAARELARSLIAMEAEQAVFEDWCRERAMHHERKTSLWRWAHTPRVRDLLASEGWACGSLMWMGGVKIWPMVLMPVGPGWPGGLAQEYAWRWVTCPACKGRIGGCALCEGLERRHVRHGDRSARSAMGRTLANLGSDLLSELEGQPSECQSHLTSAWADATISVVWRGSSVTIGPDMFAPPGWSPPPRLQDRFVLVDDRWFMPGRVRATCPNCRGTRDGPQPPRCPAADRRHASGPAPTR